MAAERRSPLDAEHRALDARMVPFGGWTMPIQYAGVVEEHLTCRSDAVAFDVSHLGTIRVAGATAHALLQRALTNDLDKVEPGRAQYTHLLDAEDAHVVDDLIVWWLDSEEFLVMPNASNTDRLVAALHSVDDTVELADVTATRAVLAVQGPHARERLAAVSEEMSAVRRFRVARVDWQGASCVVAGTGYTGEDGVEIQVPAVDAPRLWQAVLETGVVPAGLGARDTLRLEAGLPLHGHELGPGITPLQAGLGWVVAWDKEFLGREPLLAERERGVERQLVGLLVDGRRPPRDGCAVLLDGREIGRVTSGNFSPSLERGIGLALLPPEVGEGTRVVIDVRGRDVEATVGASRFLAA